MSRPLCILLFSVSACTSPTLDPDTTDHGGGKADAPEGIVHQNHRDDITVIRAELIQLQMHASILDQCEEIEIISDGLVKLDCTDAVDALIAEHVSSPGLLAHRFVTVAGKNDDGSHSPPSSGIPCQLTKLTTASRTAALDDMLELGFYFSGSSRPTRLFPAGDLVAVDEATGVDGDSRTIHELYAALPCWQGTGSSSYYATYEFKPFMDFDGDGTLYRNWDTVSSNYLLTGGAGATGFDRTAEVLQ